MQRLNDFHDARQLSIVSTMSLSLPDILAQCDPSVGLLPPKPELYDSGSDVEHVVVKGPRPNQVHFLSEPVVHQWSKESTDVPLQVGTFASTLAY